MADINQLSSSPVAGEKVNKKEEMSLSQIIGAAGDYPSPPSTGPWYEKYEWCIGNDLNESAAVKKKKYNDSISSSVKSESEKTVARPIGTVTSKSAKVGARKAVKAVTSSAASSVRAESVVKKVAKKGVEKASIVREKTRKAAKRAVDSAETIIHSEKKKRMNIKKMKRKVQFGDDRDECCTSPIIIYIYPQNNPGKSVVKHNG